MCPPQYLALVVLLLLGEVGLGGLGVVYQGQVVSGLVGGLVGRLRSHYSVPQEQQFTNALDYVQFQVSGNAGIIKYIYYSV